MYLANLMCVVVGRLDIYSQNVVMGNRVPGCIIEMKYKYLVVYERDTKSYK